MPNDRAFFDMSPKQSLVMGLSWGIALISLIAFVVSIDGKSTLLKGNGNQVAANTNVNAGVPTNQVTPPPDTGDFSKVGAVTSADHTQGPSNAKITLIEYSDFQCPYCARHLPTINQILSDYGDQVRLVFRHLPLDTSCNTSMVQQLHPNACKAAEASECAAEQGKFWEMHDLMFANQSSLDVESLKGFAGQLGLNQSQFNSCLDTGKYRNKVAANIQEANAAGISGTPGTFVNSVLVKGAYPFSTFKQIIDQQLAAN